VLLKYDGLAELKEEEATAAVRIVANPNAGQ
jgi:hypothetical protein